jgi:transcriptional regulator
MYVPRHFEEKDVGVLHQLIRAHPLGALVSLTSNGLEANHIPFLVHAGPVSYGTLHGHIARANPLWRDHASDVQALVIFQGPETYISPSWYRSKKETAKVVPTWNYAVVHAYGHLCFVDDAAWVRSHLEELTGRHESERAEPWKVTDAPPDYIEKMLRGVVGVEMTVERLIGKWKVSQNRSTSDREGVIEGLMRMGTERALAMAGLVNRVIPRSGE